MTPICPLAYRICEVYGYAPNVSGKPIAAPYNRGYIIETFERNEAAKITAKAKQNEVELQRKHKRYLDQCAAEIKAGQEREKAKNLAVINSMIINRPGLTLECIIGLVCKRFDVAPDVVLSRAQTTKRVMPRLAIVYLGRKHLKMHYRLMGKILGRDRTTILHAYNRAMEVMAFDKVFAAAVRDIEAAMKGKSPC